MPPKTPNLVLGYFMGTLSQICFLQLPGLCPAFSLSCEQTSFVIPKQEGGSEQ
jgi:hypothetical protein